jgi:N-acetylneuraminic acid mutarotase
MKTRGGCLVVLASLTLTAAVGRADSWSHAGPSLMTTARHAHTVTLLSNGTALVAGGYNGPVLDSAEVYDPVTKTWSVATPMAAARESHTATVLANGTVLVAGGVGNSGYLSSAELYDPTSDTWSAAAPMITARESHTATALATGTVLVVGGYNGTFLSSAELYDPATNTWSTAAPMAVGRYVHTATALDDGTVLVAGGFNGAVHDSAALYDPFTDTWSATGSMHTARYVHSATLLANGTVLVAGGFNGGVLSSAELYDPATGTWNVAAPMATARYAHTATVLANGMLLVAGGFSSGVLGSAELYDPAANIWSAAASMAAAREGHTAALLGNGTVLVAGGDNGIAALSSAELYDSANPPPTIAPTATPTAEIPGFVPPDANTAKCEHLVATHLKTLAACLTKCRIKQADALRRGKVFDAEACEQGSVHPVSCRGAFDKATASLLGRAPAICPACLAASAQTGLADLLAAFTADNRGPIYCAGTTPLGADPSGFVPPDANTAKCEHLVATHLKTLFACLTKCQIKQADAARSGHVFDRAACEQGSGRPVSCRAAFDKATTRLLGRMPALCPVCLDATAQSHRADGVGLFVENNRRRIYCAGTTPLPVP